MEQNTDRMGFALIALSVVAFVLLAVNGPLKSTVGGFFNGFKDWQTAIIDDVDNALNQKVKHTAYSWSEDGTDRFTTTKPNLNLILGTDAKSKSEFYTDFDKVENGYGELRLTSTNGNYDGRVNSSAYVIPVRNYVPGDVYTLSYDVMFTDWNMPSDVRNFDFGFGQRYTTSSLSPDIYDQWEPVIRTNLNRPDNSDINHWHHIVVTTVIPPHPDVSIGDEATIIFKAESATQSVLKTTLRLKNVKLEQGSVATPWMPSASEVKPSDQPKYIGTYVDKNDSASQKPSDYTWKLNPDYHE